jgi:hypothetical protein
MPVKSKKEEVAKSDIKLLITEDFDWSLIEEHPLFKKRAEEALKYLQKVGLPQHLIDKGYSVE